MAIVSDPGAEKQYDGACGAVLPMCIGHRHVACGAVLPMVSGASLHMYILNVMQ
jgi:hypothetical protein